MGAERPDVLVWLKIAVQFVKLTVTVALTIKVRNGYFNFFPLKLIIFLCTSIVEAILKIKLYVKAH